MIKRLANIVTSFRILGGVLLLFFPAFSVAFYILYILCGVSDMIDGTIARRTKSTTKFGAKIDTIADLVFVVASLIKILPTLPLSKWVWVWSAGIAILKIANIVWGYLAKKEFLSLQHMWNNKHKGESIPWNRLY